VLAAARERVPDLRGWIAGGPIYNTADHEAYPAQLEAKLREFGLEDVCTVSHVQPEAMAEFLQRLTVFVHCPDRPEPFGRSLVEAMAVGVPVVAAAGDGAIEVCGEAAAFCPLRDEDAILDALLALLGDQDARDCRARAGMARARLFDELKYGRRVADLIRRSPHTRK
jgi:glycosyltransferase involved in cell wall biosynthesis